MTMPIIEDEKKGPLALPMTRLLISQVSGERCIMESLAAWGR